MFKGRSVPSCQVYGHKAFLSVFLLFSEQLQDLISGIGSFCLFSSVCFVAGFEGPASGCNTPSPVVSFVHSSLIATLPFSASRGRAPTPGGWSLVSSRAPRALCPPGSARCAHEPRPRVSSLPAGSRKHAASSHVSLVTELGPPSLCDCPPSVFRPQDAPVVLRFPPAAVSRFLGSRWGLVTSRHATVTQRRYPAPRVLREWCLHCLFDHLVVLSKSCSGGDVRTHTSLWVSSLDSSRAFVRGIAFGSLSKR